MSPITARSRLAFRRAIAETPRTVHCYRTCVVKTGNYYVGRRPGQKPCPGALTGCETVSRKVAATSSFEQIGGEATESLPEGPAS